jgi:hypothetical protein
MPRGGKWHSTTKIFKEGDARVSPHLNPLQVGEGDKNTVSPHPNSLAVGEGD